jgi:hypothetical protein
VPDGPGQAAAAAVQCHEASEAPFGGAGEEGALLVSLGYGLLALLLIPMSKWVGRRGGAHTLLHCEARDEHHHTLAGERHSESWQGLPVQKRMVLAELMTAINLKRMRKQEKEPLLLAEDGRWAVGFLRTRLEEAEPAQPGLG